MQGSRLLLKSRSLVLIIALKRKSFLVRLQLLQIQGDIRRGCVREVRLKVYLKNLGVAVVCTSNGDTGKDFILFYFQRCHRSRPLLPQAGHQHQNSLRLH